VRLPWLLPTSSQMSMQFASVLRPFFCLCKTWLTRVRREPAAGSLVGLSSFALFPLEQTHRTAQHIANTRPCRPVLSPTPPLPFPSSFRAGRPPRGRSPGAESAQAGSLARALRRGLRGTRDVAGADDIVCGFTRLTLSCMRASVWIDASGSLPRRTHRAQNSGVASPSNGSPLPWSTLLGDIA